jgi:hypothetical protein
MDRKMILDHLELARRHVAEAERHIDQQRWTIARLERDGHDTSASKTLLEQFQQFYKMHVEDRDRLQKELDEASK